MDFLTRGDAINIMGRRIPISFLAVAATVLAAYMVFRARSRGGNIVAAGTPATPATSGALGLAAPPSVSATYDPNAAAIAQLQQSQQDVLNQLANQVSGTTPPPATPPPATPPPGQFLGTDGLLYDASGFWWVGGVPYPKWQFNAPPAPGSPGSVGFLEPPQGWPYSPIPGGTPAPTPAAAGAASPATAPSGAATLGFAQPARVPAFQGGGSIKGGAGKIVAFGWTHHGPVHGRSRSSAFRSPRNPLAPAA